MRDYFGEISVSEAAERLGVTRAHLSRILNGHAGITAPMSLRLSAALGTSPDFWLKMQMQHDLWHAQQTGRRVPFREPRAKRLLQREPEASIITSASVRRPGSPPAPALRPRSCRTN